MHETERGASNTLNTITLGPDSDDGDSGTSRIILVRDTIKRKPIKALNRAFAGTADAHRSLGDMSITHSAAAIGSESDSSVPVETSDLLMANLHQIKLRSQLSLLERIGY